MPERNTDTFSRTEIKQKKIADKEETEIMGQKNNNMRISYWCHAWLSFLFQ
jgi:hypothetical protein